MIKTIAQYREECGLTQEIMAEKLGISIPAYNMYENGKRSIPVDAVSKIKEILEIPENEANTLFLPKTFAICKNNDKDLHIAETETESGKGA